MMRRTLQVLAALVVLVGANALVYRPTLTHQFVSWDDDINVYENPFLPGAGEGDLARIWKEPHRIPLIYTTWHVLARIAAAPDPSSGKVRLDPFPFHLTNYLLHLVNAVLVFGLLLLCTSAPAFRRSDVHAGAGAAPRAPFGRRVLACLLGALVFSVHPVQAEAVSWVSALKDVLTGVPWLLAIVCYVLFVQARGRISAGVLYATATLFFGLSLLGKQTAVTLPLAAFVLGVGLYLVPMRRALLHLLPWVLLAIPFAILTKTLQPDTAVADLTPLWTRPFIALDSIAFYLFKLLVPVELCPNYGRTPQFVLEHGWLGFSWLLPASLVVMLWRSADRVLWSAALFALAWLLPVLGLTPFLHQKYSTVADRYLYLALPGVALLVAYGLLRLGGGVRGRVATAALLALLVLHGAWCHRQTQFWESGVRLHRQVIAVNPRSGTSHNSLAEIYKRQGRRQLAVRHYRLALAVDPRSGRAHNNLGNLLLEEGNLDAAERHYQAALDLGRDVVNALSNLGVVALQRNQLQRAESFFRRVLTDAPHFENAHHNLGIVMERRGRRDEAVEQYEEALRLRPDHPKANTQLAGIMIERGDVDGARQLLARAANVSADSARAHAAVARRLVAKGRLEDSRPYYQKALALGAPRPAVVLNEVGEVLERLDRCPLALQEFERAIELNADLFDAHLNRARCLRRLGRTREALSSLEAVEPRFAKRARLHHNIGLLHGDLGERDAARDAFERALAVAPDFEPSRQRLDALASPEPKAEAEPRAQSSSEVSATTRTSRPSVQQQQVAGSRNPATVP